MSCQQRSLALEPEIWGTATECTTQWVLVEYSGQWHPKMRISELNLPAEFAAALETVSKQEGWKVLWIRRPKSASKHVYWWDLNTGVCKVSEIQGPWKDGFETLAYWRFPQDIGLNVPKVLVCTHGSRDRCCGVLGGVIFRQLNQLLGDVVWQVTHLGGHRFAPTALCLPLGLLLGRIDSGDVMDIVRAIMSNSIDPLRTEIVRGDVRFTKSEQARRLWLRNQKGVLNQTSNDDSIGSFSWTNEQGNQCTTIQKQIELGNMAPSCGNPKEKMMHRWMFETQ